jgi:hypothetical protein
MFEEHIGLIDVVIELNLESDPVVTLYEDYMQSLNLDKLMAVIVGLIDQYLLKNCFTGCEGRILIHTYL